MKGPRKYPVKTDVDKKCPMCDHMKANIYTENIACELIRYFECDSCGYLYMDAVAKK